MKRWLSSTVIFVAVVIAGCASESANHTTATLYRNSNLEPSMRLHWASFDADEPDASYNIENCQMAARLLNSNYLATGGAATDGVGFWCEPGAYKSDGQQHFDFDAEYPTQ